jgi:hypothetical protein
MIATAVLFAQYTGSLDLLDTTRLQARITSPPTIIQQGPIPEKVVIAADLYTTAAARLQLRTRRWDYVLSYSTSFSLPDLELVTTPTGIQNPALIQSEGGSIAWHNRLLRITVSESGSYGQTNWALLIPQPAPVAQTQGAPGGPMQTPGGPMQPGGGIGMPGQTTGGAPPMMGQPTNLQPAAGTTTINYVSFSPAAAIAWRADRRTALSVSGGYAVNGGLTKADQAVLPLQEGGHAETSTSYIESRVDTLVTAVSGQDTFTTGACPGQPVGGAPPCNTDAPSGQAVETLRHQLSDTASLSLGAGVAVAVFEQQNFERDLVIVPAFTASFTDRFGRGVLTVSTSVAPAVDPRTGYNSQRVQGTGSYAENIDERLRVVGTAGVLQSVPIPRADPYAVTAVNGGLEARYLLDRLVSVGIGATGFWQTQSGYGIVASYVGYVAVTVLAPPLRF